MSAWHAKLKASVCGPDLLSHTIVMLMRERRKEDQATLRLVFSCEVSRGEMALFFK